MDHHHTVILTLKLKVVKSDLKNEKWTWPLNKSENSNPVHITSHAKRSNGFCRDTQQVTPDTEHMSGEPGRPGKDPWREEQGAGPVHVVSLNSVLSAGPYWHRH